MVLKMKNVIGNFSLCVLFAVALTGPMCALAQETDAQSKTIELKVDGPTIIRKGPVQMSVMDIVGHLDLRVPEADQIGLISSPARLESLIELIALTESFWVQMQDQDLGSDPRVQARLYHAELREARAIYREWFLSEAALDDYTAQARELYLTSPEFFRKPCTVDLQQILVSVPDAEAEIAGMKKIVEAYEKLMAGEDFEAVAAEYSDDPTFVDNQGLLEAIDPRSLVPSVASALASLEAGEISLPVQSRFGWHIVRLVEVNEPDVMPWDEAEEMASNMARERHLTESFERHLRELNSPSIQYSDGAVQAILDFYGLDGFGVEPQR